jgi:hypothetical protein
MNQKLQKVTREIGRTKEKIAGLQALLPKLEQQRAELENAEVIKAFRTADVAPADFAAFIEACRQGVAPALAKREAPTAKAPALPPLQPINKEDTEYDDK